MGAEYEALPPGIEWMFELDLSEEDMIAISEILRSINRPQSIFFFVSNRNCMTCGSAARFYKKLIEAFEYAGVKNKITVEIFRWDEEKHREIFHAYHVDRFPTIALLNGKIRYEGLPTGEEFGGFLETISRIGTGDYGLAPETLNALSRLKKDTKIEILVTPTCPYCPYAALLSNMFALASKDYGNGNIVSEVVELYENPDIAEKYEVMSVPTVAINGKLFQLGVPSEEILLEGLLQQKTL